MKEASEEDEEDESDCDEDFGYGDHDGEEENHDLEEVDDTADSNYDDTAAAAGSKRKAISSKGAQASKQARIVGSNVPVAVSLAAPAAASAMQLPHPPKPIDRIKIQWYDLADNKSNIQAKLKDEEAWDRYVVEEYTKLADKSEVSLAEVKKLLDEWDLAKKQFRNSQFTRVPKIVVERYRTVTWSLQPNDPDVEDPVYHLEQLIIWGSPEEILTQKKIITKRTFDKVVEDLTEASDVRHNMQVDYSIPADAHGSAVIDDPM